MDQPAFVKTVGLARTRIASHLRGFGAGPAASAVTRAAVLALALTAALAPSGLGPCEASAQAQASDTSLSLVPARFVVVAKPDAKLFARDMESSGGYDISAKLDTQTVLRVDAENDSWVRVSYPPSSRAAIEVDNATLSSDGKQAFLRQARGVKAISDQFGLRGSWRDVRFEPSITTQQPFNVLGTETTASGKNYYLVELPLSARAFIARDSVRPASQTEIDNHVSRLAEKGLAYPAAPMVAPPPADPAPTPTAEQTGQPATTTATDPSASPTGTAPSDPASAATPPAPVVKIDPEPYAKYQPLLDSFNAVRSQPPESAEYDELIAAYSEAVAELDPSKDASMRQALSQRLEILRIGKEIQVRRREVADQLAKAQGARDTARSTLDTLDPSLRYDFIGRLEASAVYDGRRMPMMYRVVSVGESYPRTLGYLRPSEQFPLSTLVGRLVGVAGEARFERSLGLRVLEPVRVDALRSQN